MRVKSYFAGTVEAAIRMARQEMGEDAMLMNSRKATAEARHLGAYEVVFAVAPDRATVSGPSAVTPPAMVPAAPASSSIAGEVAEIRRQLARMSAAVARSSERAAHHAPSHPAAAELGLSLEDAGVHPDLMLELMDAAARLPPTATARQLYIACRQELESRIAVAPGLEPIAVSAASAGCKVVALVGPPGVGKTTTLVKLAIRAGLTLRRPTQIISADTHRVASTEQLRTYAAILGVGFSAVETAAGLSQAVEEHSRKQLLFIDTPGYGPRDIELATDLARVLSSSPSIDIHLVLSCTMKSSDLSSVVDLYSIFRPSKLLFTRLDETASYGSILNEGARTHLPISFLATGQRIPDDLQPATRAYIADLVMGSREGRAAAA